LEGNRWITAKHPDPSYRKPFLVDIDELGMAFRKRYLLGLKRLVREGKLKLEGEWSRLEDPRELTRWCDELKRTDWNVFVEGPPRGESRPEHVLRYLTRYLSGGPIHDGRIIADEDGWIKFWARSRDKRKPGRLLEKKLVEKELWGPEFVRRWAMHILPKGFVRSRRYGGYHTTQSQAYLTRCRELLPPSDDETEDAREPAEPVKALLGRDSQYECPHCQVALECTSNARRPSWKQVFERDIYRDASLYVPIHHIYLRGPPQGALG
jgi:hypothetical protein